MNVHSLCQQEVTHLVRKLGRCKACGVLAREVGGVRARNSRMERNDKNTMHVWRVEKSMKTVMYSRAQGKTCQGHVRTGRGMAVNVTHELVFTPEHARPDESWLWPRIPAMLRGSKNIP